MFFTHEANWRFFFLSIRFLFFSPIRNSFERLVFYWFLDIACFLPRLQIVIRYYQFLCCSSRVSIQLFLFAAHFLIKDFSLLINRERRKLSDLPLDFKERNSHIDIRFHVPALWGILLTPILDSLFIKSCAEHINFYLSDAKKIWTVKIFIYIYIGKDKVSVILY